MKEGMRRRRGGGNLFRVILGVKQMEEIARVRDLLPLLCDFVFDSPRQPSMDPEECQPREEMLDLQMGGENKYKLRIKLLFDAMARERNRENK